jgi:molybdopterin adenylyltransferase
VTEKTNLTLHIAVLTISDTRSLDDDVSGAWLATALLQQGHVLHSRKIVRDDVYHIRAVLSALIADDSCHVVVCTGGTGFTGRDSTPEAITPLLDKHMPGFGEVFRMLSFADVGASTMQSRALAGIANATFIFALPGSRGACQLAWDQLISPQLNANSKPCNLVDLIPRLRER